MESQLRLCTASKFCCWGLMTRYHNRGTHTQYVVLESKGGKRAEDEEKAT